MQHLYHFCSTLPRQAYVDNKPEFSFDQNDNGFLKAKVILPSCVDPKVRRAEGKSWWQTERAARKEAAFEAYKALHMHGLVNDNLLPLTKSRDFTRSDLSSLPAIQDVSGQYDPWMDWASAWSSPNMHQSRVIIRKGSDKMYMKMISPTALPCLDPMTLFWDHQTRYSVEFEPAEPVSMTRTSLDNMRTATALYLQAASTRPIARKKDFITLFGPDLSSEKLALWLKKNQGHESAVQVLIDEECSDLCGVIRNHAKYGEILLFKRWIDSPDGLEIECTSYPKRRNLLQPMHKPLVDEVEAPTEKRVSANDCSIDRLPAAESVFGRFIAVILDRLEAALVASKLCKTVLRDVPFSELRHVITAITMPQAQAPSDYQRYEFFGDSVLKFTTAASLYYEYPSWHEGYLTEGLTALVQNGRLAKAARERGLDAFIISKQFTPRKWTAPMIEEIQASGSPPSATRELSTKVLADVVEALIGAAYIDGGHEKAQAAICCFLPESTLRLPRARSDTDIDMPDASDSNPSNQRRLIQQDALEESIGYKFTNSALLVQALTHASCQFDASTQSYQRLEFLGDAVLDMLVVDMMLSHPRQLAQGEMTKIKHAMVNANLLAFLCMEFGAEPSSDSDLAVDLNHTTNNTPSGKEDNDTISPSPLSTNPPPQTTKSIYTHLRHSPTTPLLSTTTALSRHALLRTRILQSLSTEKAYPWALLSALNADKFFSDIIESIIGAIYVDSKGDLDKCKRFIGRLGLGKYLCRVLDEDVDVLHPVQRAQILLQRVWARRGMNSPENGEGFESESQSGTGTGTRTGFGLFRTTRVLRSGVGGEEGGVVGNEIEKGGIHAGDNGNDNVDDDDDVDDGVEGEEELEATYTCTIALSGYVIGLEDVVVSGGVSREDAEVRAAILVVEKLEGFERRKSEEEE